MDPSAGFLSTVLKPRIPAACARASIINFELEAKMKQVLFGNLVRSVDRFGYQVEMHFEGQAQYKTVFGGVVTLVIYVMITINAFNICTDFVLNDNR